MAKKVTEKNKKNNLVNKKRALAAALNGLVDFPVPGAQNCFENGLPFTATGTIPAGSAIARVRLFRPGMAPLVATLTIDAMAGTWSAEFPINGPADLPPDRPNVLVVELDANPRRQYAMRFSHVPPPPTIEIERIEARPDHQTYVEGFATGLNSGINNEFTLLVDGSAHAANYDNNTQEFNFTTPSTPNATQELIFRLQNAAGAADDIPVLLTVDQEPPLFDPDPPTLDTLSVPPNFIFTGTVVDEGSGFENAAALVVKLDGQTNGPIDPLNYDVRPILSADSKTIDFTITVDTAVVGPDFYTLTLDATDVAGNTRRATKIFLVT